jgi:hypothetical protein
MGDLRGTGTAAYLAKGSSQGTPDVAECVRRACDELAGDHGALGVRWWRKVTLA